MNSGFDTYDMFDVSADTDNCIVYYSDPTDSNFYEMWEEISTTVTGNLGFESYIIAQYLTIDEPYNLDAGG
jgi:hypothetical protein